MLSRVGLALLAGSPMVLGAPTSLSVRAETCRPKELGIEIITNTTALRTFLAKAGHTDDADAEWKLGICGGIQQATTDKPRFDATRLLASSYYGDEIGTRIVFPINKDGKGTVRLFCDVCEMVDKNAGVEQNGYQCDFSYDTSLTKGKPSLGGAQRLELSDNGFQSVGLGPSFSGAGCERVEYPTTYQFTIEKSADTEKTFHSTNEMEDATLCGGVAEPGATELRWRSSRYLVPDSKKKGAELYADGKIDQPGSVHLYYDSCVAVGIKSEAGYECTFDYTQVEKIDGKWPKFDQKVVLESPQGETSRSGDPDKVKFKFTSVDTNLQGDKPKPVCRKLDRPVKVVGNPGFQLTELGLNNPRPN